MKKLTLSFLLAILSLSAFSSPRDPLSGRRGDPDSVLMCKIEGNRSFWGNIDLYMNRGSVVDYQILQYRFGLGQDAYIEHDKQQETVTLTAETNVYGNIVLNEVFIDLKNSTVSRTVIYRTPNLGKVKEKEEFVITNCLNYKF